MANSPEEDDDIQILELDHSLGPKQSDMETIEERIEKLMKEKQSISALFDIMDAFFKMNAKLELCMQLFFESSGIRNEVKDYIFNGKLIDAYKNFIRFEGYRNELMAISNSTGDDCDVVARRFAEVEIMAIQIRDVIRLTIASTSHIEESIIDQVSTILANEKRLDELSEKQKENDKKPFLGRPRQWTAMCTQILDEQVSRNKGGNHELITTAIKKQLSMPINEKSALTDTINDECDHHEELRALSKYFSSLRQKEELFQAELNKLFNSNSALNEAHEHLINGNICAAYERLIRIESIRFNLLSEIRAYHNTSSVQKMIEECSHSLEESFSDFVKYSSYLCSRALDVMRNKDREPRKQLELLLRIIEIDHKIDKQYESLNMATKQRPHCWRHNFFQLIEQRIQERIEVFHVEKKSNNENWIARYLEICRMFIVEDLYAAKHFLRFFPKEHQLYDRFVLFYHKGISNKLCEIITSELDRREIIQLLNWIRIYPSLLSLINREVIPYYAQKETRYMGNAFWTRLVIARPNFWRSEQLLGMPFLQVNASALLDDYPLLPDEELERLQDQFINATKSEVNNWAIKAIRQEFAIKEKHRMENVEEDASGCYYTQLPYILFSIIHDQISLAKEISDNMVPRMLDTCLGEFIKASYFFQREAIAFKNRSYDDREHVDFTAIMVTIANDLDMCIESTEKLRKYFPSLSSATLPQPDVASSSIVPVDLVKVYAEMPQKEDMPGKVYRDDSTSKKKQHFAMRSAIRGAVSTIKDMTIARISPSPSSASLTELSTKMAKGRQIFNVVGAPLMLEQSNETSLSDSPVADGISDSVPTKAELSGVVCLDDDLQLASDAETPQLSAVEKFYELKGRFSAILHIIVSSLRDEVCDDLTEFFEQLLHKKWLKCSDAIDTICVTILDYYSDHKHLRSRLQLDLLTYIETRLVAEYISSVVNRELTCSNYEKRSLIAESLRRDAHRINKTFQPIYQEQKRNENVSDLSNVLLRLADFISLNDKGMLSLESASLIRTYPDMPSEVLFALIDIRDDMSSFESRAMAEECVRMVDNGITDGIFTTLLRLCKGERKKSQLIRDVVPRLRRKVKLSIA